MEEFERDEQPARELYALLHLSPEASDEDIKKAYRQWAQIYHPDKHQSPQMQDIATANFQRIREAYEILSSERKRQIYDIYGMQGLTSGLELGPKLKTREEVKAEFERLQQRQEDRRLAAHVHHQGSLLVNLSLAQFLQSFDTGPRMNGMAMSTQVQVQLSKRDTVVLGGNMALRRGLGGGSVTVVLRRQLSPLSSLEVLGMVGLRSILSIQTSRQLSSHSTGTLDLTVSLRDGSITLANTWSRQLSEETTGNIQLITGTDTGISVGWQRHGKKNAGSGELKVGPTTFGLSGQYIRHFSSKSQGRVSAKLGSTGVEVEIGGERRVSEHSSAAMFCVLGLQGVLWRVRFTRGGQKFVLPIFLCSTLNPVIATGALVLPSSLYALIKIFVLKPYYLRRKRLKSLEQRRLTVTQVLEARATSEKAQMLLRNVAEQKKRVQAERDGLVILEALYGAIKSHLGGRTSNSEEDGARPEEDDSDLPPPYLDVAIPLQFLVNDHGQLQLYAGVKKAGLMGFCDPCPGETKQLEVAYSFQSSQYQVVVGDYEELRLPQEAHRTCNARSLSSENLNQEPFSGLLELETILTAASHTDSVEHLEARYTPGTSCNTEICKESRETVITCMRPRLIVVITGKRPPMVAPVTAVNDPSSKPSAIQVRPRRIKPKKRIKIKQQKRVRNLKKTGPNSHSLSFEQLATIFSSATISQEMLGVIRKIDDFGVLKGACPVSIARKLDEWAAEGRRMGFGWVTINGDTFGVRVDCIQAWLVCLILIHENRTNTKIEKVAHFKLGIDARAHNDKPGSVCEVMMELLCDMSPLSCISVAKWAGKDHNWDQTYSYIADKKDPQNLMQQLYTVQEDGLDLGEGRRLEVAFIECHHMAFFRTAVCNGCISAFGDQFCPWCNVKRKCQLRDVTTKHALVDGDTVTSLATHYHMRPAMLVELNPCLEGIGDDEPILESLPARIFVTVLSHWPTNRQNLHKLFPGYMSAATYCARHALIRTVLHMMRAVVAQAQCSDVRSLRDPKSRLELLREAMDNPPLSIPCQIKDSKALPGQSTLKELKYDEFDEAIAHHILNHHDILLKVIEGLPSTRTFSYTKRMWSTYQRFNVLQQMVYKFHPYSHDDSLPVLAKEFLFSATQALGENVTPYIHIQGAHAAQFQSTLPYSIGRLKNSATERKQKELKSSQTLVEMQFGSSSKLDKFGLDTEMRAQYVRLKIEAMPIIEDLGQRLRSWVPWTARAYYRRHFKHVPPHITITSERAMELAQIFPPTSTSQVLHLFNTWSKQRASHAFPPKPAIRRRKPPAASHYKTLQIHLHQSFPSQRVDSQQLQSQPSASYQDQEGSENNHENTCNDLHYPESILSQDCQGDREGDESTSQCELDTISVRCHPWGGVGISQPGTPEVNSNETSCSATWDDSGFPTTSESSLCDMGNETHHRSTTSENPTRQGDTEKCSSMDEGSLLETRRDLDREGSEHCRSSWHNQHNEGKRHRAHGNFHKQRKGDIYQGLTPLRNEPPTDLPHITIGPTSSHSSNCPQGFQIDLCRHYHSEAGHVDSHAITSLMNNSLTPEGTEMYGPDGMQWSQLLRISYYQRGSVEHHVTPPSEIHYPTPRENPLFEALQFQREEGGRKHEDDGIHWSQLVRNSHCQRHVVEHHVTSPSGKQYPSPRVSHLCGKPLSQSEESLSTQSSCVEGSKKYPHSKSSRASALVRKLQFPGQQSRDGDIHATPQKHKGKGKSSESHHAQVRHINKTSPPKYYPPAEDRELSKTGHSHRKVPGSLTADKKDRLRQRTSPYIFHAQLVEFEQRNAPMSEKHYPPPEVLRMLQTQEAETQLIGSSCTHERKLPWTKPLESFHAEMRDVTHDSFPSEGLEVSVLSMSLQSSEPEMESPKTATSEPSDSFPQDECLESLQARYESLLVQFEKIKQNTSQTAKNLLAQEDDKLYRSPSPLTELSEDTQSSSQEERNFTQITEHWSAKVRQNGTALSDKRYPTPTDGRFHQSLEREAACCLLSTEGPSQERDILLQSKYPSKDDVGHKGKCGSAESTYTLPRVNHPQKSNICPLKERDNSQHRKSPNGPYTQRRNTSSHQSSVRSKPPGISHIGRQDHVKRETSVERSHVLRSSNGISRSRSPCVCDGSFGVALPGQMVHQSHSADSDFGNAELFHGPDVSKRRDRLQLNDHSPSTSIDSPSTHGKFLRRSPSREQSPGTLKSHAKDYGRHHGAHQNKEKCPVPKIRSGSAHQKPPSNASSSEYCRQPPLALIERERNPVSCPPPSTNLNDPNHNRKNREKSSRKGSGPAQGQHLNRMPWQ